MGVRDSVEGYAEKLNMTVEQAKVRLDHFASMQEGIKESKKCPKCGMYTLEIDGGEWEAGVQAFIYCENDEVPTVDEDGEEYLESCEFTDSPKDCYIFASEPDFDEVLMVSCSINIYDEVEVRAQLGQTWEEFVEESNKHILETIERDKDEEK